MSNQREGVVMEIFISANGYTTLLCPMPYIVSDIQEKQNTSKILFYKTPNLIVSIKGI